MVLVLVYMDTVVRRKWLFRAGSGSGALQAVCRYLVFRSMLVGISLVFRVASCRSGSGGFCRVVFLQVGSCSGSSIVAGAALTSFGYEADAERVLNGVGRRQREEEKEKQRGRERQKKRKKKKNLEIRVQSTCNASNKFCMVQNHSGQSEVML